MLVIRIVVVLFRFDSWVFNRMNFDVKIKFVPDTLNFLNQLHNAIYFLELVKCPIFTWFPSGRASRRAGR